MPGVLGSPGSLAASPSILGTPGAFASTGSGPGRPPATVDYTDGPRFGHGFDSYLRDSGLRHPTADGRYPVTASRVSKGWLLPRFHHPCRSSAFLSEYSRLEDYPRATGWFSKSWWNGLASRLTSLHGKIKKLFVKAFLWPLLGDKQASKGQGMLPTRQWRRCPSRYNSKMAQYRMVQASRMRQLVVCIGPTGAYMGPSGCRPAGTQRLACV